MNASLFLLVFTISVVTAAEISIEVFEESIIPKGKANTTSEITGPLLSAKSDTTSDKNETGKLDPDPKAMAVGVPVDFAKEQKEAAARVTKGKAEAKGRDHSKRMGDQLFGAPKSDPESIAESADGFTASETAAAPSFSLPAGQRERGPGGGIWSMIPANDDESRSFDRFISGWNSNFRNQQQEQHEGKESASSLSASVVSPLDPVVASAPAAAIDPSLAALRALASSQPFAAGHSSSSAGSDATQFGEELGLSAYPAAAGESTCCFIVTSDCYQFCSFPAEYH